MKLKRYIQFASLLLVCVLLHLSFHDYDDLLFKEVSSLLPNDGKSLRKWDAPVIVDLDQDGYTDIIINDHGYGARVCWNNKGKFSMPYDFIIGDVHGMTVGDFNLDGLLEIVVSRGGGSGSNARNSKLIQVNKNRTFSDFPNLNVPLETMRGRTVKFFDGNNDGILDLLNFGFPDKHKAGKSESYVYKGSKSGQLELVNTLPPTRKDGQKTLITDLNSDHIFDLLVYGEGHVKAFQGRGDLSYLDVTDKVFPNKIENVTSIVELDFDQDGDMDLFFTRGEDFQAEATFYDAKLKRLGFYVKGEFYFNNLQIGDILQLNNVHTQWPHNSAYFIGESGYPYEFEGETHSGKFIKLVNSDALGFVDEIGNKGGVYIGYIGNEGWRLAGKVGAPMSGVIENVSNFKPSPFIKGYTNVLLENKGGVFVDVSLKMGIDEVDHAMCAVSVDLDNNGFEDIITLSRGDLIHPLRSSILLNTGKSSFTYASGNNIVSNDIGASALGIETLDFNNDGKMDIVVGNERGKWHLFNNIVKTNAKSITVKVGNSPTNKATALGAMVSLKACSLNQKKRIGSNGANYSLSFNSSPIFGLGSCNEDLTIIVEWTNGEKLIKTVESTTLKLSLGLF